MPQRLYPAAVRREIRSSTAYSRPTSKEKAAERSAAFGMVRSGLKPAGDDQRSGEGSFQSGILLQVLNVKSWVAALSIFSVYVIPFTTAVGAMLLAALAFTLFCALACLLWFGCGAAIQRLYRRFRLPVSIVLAATLVLCAWSAVK